MERETTTPSLDFHEFSTTNSHLSQHPTPNFHFSKFSRLRIFILHFSKISPNAQLFFFQRPTLSSKYSPNSYFTFQLQTQTPISHFSQISSTSNSFQFPLFPSSATTSKLSIFSLVPPFDLPRTHKFPHHSKISSASNSRVQLPNKIFIGFFFAGMILFL